MHECLKRVTEADRLIFQSSIPAYLKTELERLLFFNPSQRRYAEHIIKSVDRIGKLEILQNESKLSLAVSENIQVQNLFVFDQICNYSKTLVAAAIYTRHPLDRLLLLHIAVDPNYALGGIYEDCLVTFQLIQKIIAIGKTIKGVDKIEIIYGERSHKLLMLNLLH